jgi:hypothetical protein
MMPQEIKEPSYFVIQANTIYFSLGYTNDSRKFQEVIGVDVI